ISLPWTEQGDRKGSPLLYYKGTAQARSSIVGAIPCGRPGSSVRAYGGDLAAALWGSPSEGSYRLRFFFRDCLAILFLAFFLCDASLLRRGSEEPWGTVTSLGVQRGSMSAILSGRFCSTSSADFKPSVTCTSSQSPITKYSTRWAANACSINGAASLASRCTRSIMRK